MNDPQKPAPAAPTASGDPTDYIRYGLATAAVLFGGFLSWAALARVDSAVIAPGVVSVETNRKAVQHLEGGIIQELFVRETQVVREGELLARLSPVQAEAAFETHQSAFDAAQALEARLTAELRSADAITFPTALVERARIREQTGKVLEDQEIQFRERRSALNVQIDILQKRAEQLRQQLVGSRAVLASAENQHRSLKEEFAKLDALAKKSYFPLNRVMELSRRIDEQLGRIGQINSDIAKNDETIAEIQLQILQVTRKHKEEVAQALRDIRVNAAEIAGKMHVAKDIYKRLEVRAPVSGTVQGLRFHNIGAVVRPGEPMMDIVPAEEVLVAQIRVSPIDINYVSPDMQAEVRFPGIKSRRTPVILGRIRSVAADSSRDDATKESFFLAVAEVKLADLPRLATGSRITAGMPVEVIVPTGERTVMDYWISPLSDAAMKTMREN